MQRMGDNDKEPIGKHQEGITEPLEPPSQFSRDKTRLGYGHNIPPRQK